MRIWRPVNGLTRPIRRWRDVIQGSKEDLPRSQPGNGTRKIAELHPARPVRTAYGRFPFGIDAKLEGKKQRFIAKTFLLYAPSAPLRLNSS
jgi:hypothetical protein